MPRSHHHDPKSPPAVPSRACLADMADGRRITPMFRQFLEIKEQAPDAILFFRMGDFYELFFEDAEIAAGLLDLTLTARDKSGEQPIPMAGVPHHAVRPYIVRLVEAGYKVAIADQVEDPKLAKGIVRRALTELITPGLILDPENLDARSANYLAAVHATKKSGFGLSWIDVSTGEFACTEVDDPAGLRAELGRIAPSEVLISESFYDEELRQDLERTLSLRWTEVPHRAFGISGAREELEQLFGLKGLDGLGLSGATVAVQASGAVIDYLRTSHIDALGHVRPLRLINVSSFMTLDDSARRNLEIFRTLSEGKRKGSLLGLMDRAITSMGSRLIRRWLGAPLLDPVAINGRLDAVDILVRSGALRSALVERLELVHDIERLNGKVISGRANARDLLALQRSLAQLPALDILLDREDAQALPVFAPLPDLSVLAADIDDCLTDDPPLALKDGGLIRRGVHPELDEIVELSREGKGALVRLEAEERKKTGIASLKVRYNRVFGYYIEVTKPNLKYVPEHYIRKQTLANAERFYTPELKEFEAKILGAEERRCTLEYELFEQLRDRVAQAAPLLADLADRVAAIDAVLTFAGLAVDYDYVRPEVDDSEVLDLRASRHPVIERMDLGERFVPNDVLLDREEHQLLIVSGPNMAGKSTVMRQVALCMLMAQAGCFVPATSARIGVADRIFTRVGASDNIARGQSTFMVEMAETAAILATATSRSLAVLDEIGRGTSTYDGVAIAWAVAEYFADTLGCRTMFATHYHELCELARTRPQVQNVNIAVSEVGGRVIFLRRLREGGASRSYGIQVAKLAGLPEQVLVRAREVLANLEIDSEDSVGRPRLARGRGGDTEPPQGQLSLFSGREEVLRDELLGVDVDKLTPLEALNMLADLRGKAERC